ncbi:hypothetical protein Tco_0896600, partial [Tanacetum coccineum]
MYEICLLALSEAKMQSASTGEQNPLSQRHQEINMASTSSANDPGMKSPLSDLIK